MYFVYIIRSVKNNVLYFGRTDDLERRLRQHNTGNNLSTKKNLPWEFVYVEGYRSEKDAISRELQLKDYGNARTYVKKRIKNSLL